MRFTSICRRSATVVGGAAALAMVASGPASAHHCLKEWNDAARAQVASGTSWMLMSDFFGLVVGEFYGLPDACVAHADEWTAAWMEANDVATEPTLHMKATVGGGAAHQGKTVPPFRYLTEADQMWLDGLVMAEEDCQPPEPEGA